MEGKVAGDEDAPLDQASPRIKVGIGMEQEPAAKVDLKERVDDR